MFAIIVAIRNKSDHLSIQWNLVVTNAFDLDPKGKTLQMPPNHGHKHIRYLTLQTNTQLLVSPIYDVKDDTPYFVKYHPVNSLHVRPLTYVYQTLCFQVV